MLCKLDLAHAIGRAEDTLMQNYARKGHLPTHRLQNQARRDIHCRHRMEAGDISGGQAPLHSESLRLVEVKRELSVDESEWLASGKKRHRMPSTRQLLR